MLFGGGNKGGEGGGLPNMMEAFKKAQEVGKKAKEMQEELGKMEIEGKSSNGKAMAFCNGQQIPIRVEIDESLLSEGKDIVGVAAVEAMFDSHDIALDTMTKKMADMYESIGLPKDLMGGLTGGK
eukprot:CAMPEP_0113944538 /NCGR_PEP_ID=MMETSP1339-20121228/34486_1 /TAXON_ID=94617 /ORGANISM="Fibrocapsa japonica" /LENGTH=124 /DNA_ID=CAMNT_0000949773 /DNA_START=210 /DNA_END=584 /DNA_ORIENTATION=+ /assembly_acc=CAM_ASM_000762